MSDEITFGKASQNLVVLQHLFFEQLEEMLADIHGTLQYSTLPDGVILLLVSLDDTLHFNLSLIDAEAQNVCDLDDPGETLRCMAVFAFPEGLDAESALHIANEWNVRYARGRAYVADRNIRIDYLVPTAMVSFRTVVNELTEWIFVIQRFYEFLDEVADGGDPDATDDEHQE